MHFGESQEVRKQSLPCMSVHHYFTGLSFVFPVKVSVIILPVSVLSSLCECPSLFYWSQFCLPCVSVHHYFTGLIFVFPVCVSVIIVLVSVCFLMCVLAV